MSAASWLIEDEDGNHHGPFTSAQLKEACDLGLVSPDSLVMDGRDQTWVLCKRALQSEGFSTQPPATPLSGSDTPSGPRQRTGLESGNAPRSAPSSATTPSRPTLPPLRQKPVLPDLKEAKKVKAGTSAETPRLPSKPMPLFWKGTAACLAVTGVWLLWSSNEKRPSPTANQNFSTAAREAFTAAGGIGNRMPSASDQHIGSGRVPSPRPTPTRDDKGPDLTIRSAQQIQEQSVSIDPNALEAARAAQQQPSQSADGTPGQGISTQPAAAGAQQPVTPPEGWASPSPTPNMDPQNIPQQNHLQQGAQQGEGQQADPSATQPQTPTEFGSPGVEPNLAFPAGTPNNIPVPAAATPPSEPPPPQPQGYGTPAESQAPTTYENPYATPPPPEVAPPPEPPSSP